MIARLAALLLVALAASIAMPDARADDTAAKQRVAAALKKLDDLRDNATADDYRTIQVRVADGRITTRRIPTEEFAARIEQAERERDAALAALKQTERSLY